MGEMGQHNQITDSKMIILIIVALDDDDDDDWCKFISSIQF